MIKKSRGTGCPPWCEDRDVAGERDHEVHFTDLGSVAGTHPDLPGTTATVVVALVQDAHGELATQVSLLGDDPMLALLVPEAAETLARLTTTSRTALTSPCCRRTGASPRLPTRATEPMING